MVEPRPMAVFLARLRVGCGFGSMVLIARRRPHCGTNDVIHSFSVVSRRGDPTWNGRLRLRCSRLPLSVGEHHLRPRPVCSTITLILDDYGQPLCTTTPEIEYPYCYGNICKAGPP